LIVKKIVSDMINPMTNSLSLIFNFMDVSRLFFSTFFTFFATDLKCLSEPKSHRHIPLFHEMYAGKETVTIFDF